MKAAAKVKILPLLASHCDASEGACQRNSAKADRSSVLLRLHSLLAPPSSPVPFHLLASFMSTESLRVIDLNVGFAEGYIALGQAKA